MILLMLSTARITRFVTTDKLSEPLRVSAMKRLNPEGSLAYLIHCDWCSSIYVGAGVASVWHFWGDSGWTTAGLVALSASYAAGLLNSKADD